MATQREIRAGLIGFGTIGTGVVKLMQRRAAAIDTPTARLHTNIGNELTALKRCDEARAEYDAALALAPNDANALAAYAALRARAPN